MTLSQVPLQEINHHLCCNDKCLIYLLTWKVCKKIYTGKTVDRFRLRWNYYKESDREFLTGEEISICLIEEDVSICLIDKTDPSDPHKKEYYWMRTLKTKAPFGLIAEETYWVVYTVTCFTSILPVYYCLKYVNLNIVSLLCCCVFTFLHYMLPAMSEV